MEGVVTRAVNPSPVPEDAVRLAARLRALAGKGKVIVFTSPAAGEDSSAVAAAVGMALAQLDLGEVLVMDANLQAPRSEGRFGLPRAPGLSDVLLGATAFEQAARPTQVERLSVLAAGTPVPGPAVLRTLATFRSAVQQARHRYEYVLVDGPEFAASAIAPAIVAEGDGVVMVVPAGAHRRSELVQWRRELDGLQARLLGVVLATGAR